MKIKQILKYLSSFSIFRSIPVYNLNWFKNSNFFKGILGEATITLVDVGARNVSVEELMPLQRHLRYIGFDADSEEVERLNQKRNNFKSSKFISAFVGKKDELVKFDIHYKEGESSILPFSENYIKWFLGGGNNYIKKQIEIRSNSLDELIDEDIDFIKLDTQGTEYEILGNAQNCLNSTLMVECEVEFFQVYKKQKLAHDIFEMMNNLGFELLYLNRIFGQSSYFKGESRGQIVFGDALFGLSREKAINLEFRKKIKYIALLINYGHIDFAFDIYKNCTDLQMKLPKLKKFFNKNNSQKKVLKGLKILVDKFIFFLLALRKTNGIGHDSDRSWPTR